MLDQALLLGEALVDIIHSADGTVTERAGGSPANVAVALARLGRSTSLVTDLADDRLGRFLRNHLDTAGVNLVRASKIAGSTASAEARIGEDGSAAYTFDLRFDIAAPSLVRPPVVVHTGSIGAVLDPGAAVVLETLRSSRPTSTVTYDLNIRRRVMGSLWTLRARVERLVALADVVKAADDDLDALYPELAVDVAARRLLGLGPACVLVTRGGGSVTAYLANGERVVQETRRVVVVDTIGAGDAFTAAVIDRLWSLDVLGADRHGLYGLDRDRWGGVLRYAATAASIAVSRSGADPAWRDELDQELGVTTAGDPSRHPGPSA